VIGTEDQFKRLLPRHQLVKDRKLDKEYGIVKAGDMLRMRVID
jgi:hypothetical protein